MVVGSGRLDVSVRHCVRNLAPGGQPLMQALERCDKGQMSGHLIALDCCRIGSAPVSGDGMPGPERAGLVRRVIAEGDDHINGGRLRSRTFLPALRAEAVGGIRKVPQGVERIRVYGTFGMTSRAIGTQPVRRQMIAYGLSHNTPRRVPGAEKEDRADTPTYQASPGGVSLSRATCSCP